MKTYKIAADNAIHGDQLVKEIQAAHGIDISDSYGFIPPRTVEVAGFDAVDLQPTITAHKPPAAPAFITKREFMERFLDDEAVEILNSRDKQVVKAYNRLVLHPVDAVNLKAPDTVMLVNYMESTALRADGVTKILAAGRAAEILAS